MSNEISSFELKLEKNFRNVLTMLFSSNGFKFAREPKIQLNDSHLFSARAYYDNNVKTCVEINRGCIDQIESLWGTVLDKRILLNIDGQKLLNPDSQPLDKDYLAHTSLVWLVLHELMHVRLGHL